MVIEVDYNESGRIEFDDFLASITKADSFKKILPSTIFCHVFVYSLKLIAIIFTMVNKW